MCHVRMWYQLQIKTNFSSVAILIFKLSVIKILSADNTPVSASKHYQLSLKQKLMVSSRFAETRFAETQFAKIKVRG